MAKIVAVHGIAQQLMGEESLRALWLPFLRDGLTRAGSPGLLENEHDLFCAFYGDLFRPPGRLPDKSLDLPWTASDVTDDWERDLLAAWWEEAARVDAAVPLPDDAGSKARVPQLVQDALYAMSHSRFFAGLATRALIGNLRQVRAYLHDDEARSSARARLTAAIGDDTVVMIGHSLGSIVAYEALCEHDDWPVRVFVTLGSPLGIPNLIFDRLRPAPSNGKGAWPGCLTRWFNIADQGDVVALKKLLAPQFDGFIEDYLIHNGATAHDVQAYLTAAETGRAIVAGLLGHSVAR